MGLHTGRAITRKGKLLLPNVTGFLTSCIAVHGYWILTLSKCSSSCIILCLVFHCGKNMFTDSWRLGVLGSTNVGNVDLQNKRLVLSVRLFQNVIRRRYIVGYVWCWCFFLARNETCHFWQMICHCQIWRLPFVKFDKEDTVVMKLFFESWYCHEYRFGFESIFENNLAYSR